MRQKIMLKYQFMSKYNISVSIDNNIHNSTYKICINFSK